MAGVHQLWVMDLSSGVIAPFAGNAREGTRDDLLAQAELAQSSGLALDGQGRLYFADAESSIIRWAEIDRQDSQIGTLAGSGRSLFDFGDVDGVGQEARLQHPLGVTYFDGQLYVADTYNSKIKRVYLEQSHVHRTPEQVQRTCETFVGSEQDWRDGADPLFYEPGGLDAANGRLYVADTNNHAVRIVEIASGETRTLVLKGIQRFMPADQETAFDGEIITLDPVDLGAGHGKILLNVTFPQGYKVNEQAPYSMAWEVKGEVVVLAPDANRSISAPQFPLEIEATFQEGQGVLSSDLTIIYCEAQKESLCLIERVRLKAPLQIHASGPRVLELQHQVELPTDLFGAP